MELLGGTRHAKCAQMSEWVTDHVCATVPTVRLMDGLGYTTNHHTNQQKLYQKWDFAMQLYQPRLVVALPTVRLIDASRDERRNPSAPGDSLRCSLNSTETQYRHLNEIKRVKEHSKIDDNAMTWHSVIWHMHAEFDVTLHQKLDRKSCIKCVVLKKVWCH